MSVVCDYVNELKDGYCLYKKAHCDGKSLFEFDDELIQIEEKDVCKKSSLFGNYYISLSDEQIELLKKGFVLALTEEEYNIFIKYKKEGAADE